MAQKEYQPIEGVEFLDFSQWKFHDLLASSNNNVYCYCHENDESRTIAVKEILYNEEDDENGLFESLRRIERVRQLRNENIIQVYGAAKVIKHRAFKLDYSIMVGMEQADFNLEDSIRIQAKKQEYFSGEEIRNFIQDILSSMFVLQKNMICHRDIKPENIFKKGNRYILGDLDDIKIRGNKTQDKSIVWGTLAYSAPELLKAMANSSTRLEYNAYKSDLYSFGLVLLYMCRLKKFNAEERMNSSQKQIKLKIKQECKMIKQRYRDFGKEISDTIKVCLVSNPFQRKDIIGLYKGLCQRGFLIGDLKRISPSYIREFYYQNDMNDNSQILRQESESFQNQSHYNVSQTASYSTQNMQNFMESFSPSNYSPNNPHLDRTQEVSRNNTYSASNLRDHTQNLRRQGTQKAQIVYNPNISIVNRQKTNTVFNALNNEQQQQVSFEESDNITESSQIQSANNESIFYNDLKQLQSQFKSTAKLSQSAMRCRQEYELQFEEIKKNQQTKCSFTKKQKIGFSIIILVLLAFLVVGIVYIFKFKGDGICKPGKFEFGDQCVDSCEKGYFGNSLKQLCETCQNQCTGCVGGKECAECTVKPSYVGIEENCVKVSVLQKKQEKEKKSNTSSSKNNSRIEEKLFLEIE